MSRLRSWFDRGVLFLLLSLPTENPLGAYDPSFFIGDPHSQELVAKFRMRLTEISAKIEQRNPGLEVPYTFLHPAQIGQSIAI